MSTNTDSNSGEKGRKLRKASPVVRTAQEILHGGAIGAARYLVDVANGLIKERGVSKLRLRAAMRVLDYELGEPRKIIALQGQQESLLSYTQLILLAEGKAVLQGLPAPINTAGAYCSNQEAPDNSEQAMRCPESQEQADTGLNEAKDTITKGAIVVDVNGYRWKVIDASEPTAVKLRAVNSPGVITTRALDNLALDKGEQSGREAGSEEGKGEDFE